MTFGELKVGDEFCFTGTDFIYMKMAPTQHTLNHLHSKFFLNFVVIKGPGKGTASYCTDDIEVVPGVPLPQS